MVKKCIYCGQVLDDGVVLDVCRKCGLGVWGEKMFETIIANMEGAYKKGDLYQGSVGEEEKVGMLDSIVQEGLANAEKFAEKEEVIQFPSEKSAQELIAEPITEIATFKN